MAVIAIVATAVLETIPETSVTVTLMVRLTVAIASLALPK